MHKRLKSRKKWFNIIDPVYLLLDIFIFKILFQPPKSGERNGFEKLESSEEDFLVENLGKHRVLLWANIFLSIFLWFWGIDLIVGNGSDPNNLSIAVTGLLAPAMITGAAWFAISFGGIPEKFIGAAYWLTLSMFLSFTLSMTLLTGLLMSITPSIIGLVILVIYISVYLASVWYDNVDGLKIGLDSTMLKFSRANLIYFKKHGLVGTEEIQGSSFDDSMGISSTNIALFSYYIETLNRNLIQLENKNDLIIANHLIISSTDLLLSILNLFQKKDDIPLKLEEYEVYSTIGYQKEQNYVDITTAIYLKQIVEQFSRKISDENSDLEFKVILKRIDQFREMDNNNQIIADHLLAQVFRQLSELISAYRHIIFSLSGN